MTKQGIKWTAVGLVAAGLGLWAGAAAAETYNVRVTNLTRGQIISPPVVAAHLPNVAIFAAGEEASEGLAALAEDAASTLLVADLIGAGADVEEAAGGIPPGGYIDVVITTSAGNTQISAVGMLVTTNDAFFALNGVALPADSATYSVPAYDAGSEANNENCDYIPGPPCGNGGVRDTEGAEGFVHIHNGIHGDTSSSGKLQADRDDWRNPVARVTVTLVSPS